MHKNWTEDWDLKKAIGGNFKVGDGPVVFKYFRDNVLYYETYSGFMFRVPVEDTAGATFQCMDKPIFFMRWIRKELEQLKKDKLEAKCQT